MATILICIGVRIPEYPAPAIVRHVRRVHQHFSIGTMVSILHILTE